MRRWIDLVESFTDDTATAAAHLLDKDANLTMRGFAKERDDLVSAYKIDDPDAEEAVHLYTKDSSINKALIRGKRLSKAHKKLLDQLKKLEDLTPGLPEEHHVYSGTGLFDPMAETDDGVFATPAFLSTSLSVRVAAKTNNFRRHEKKEDRDHLMHLILPKGYRGCFYIGGYSDSPEELEMLIFPGEEFKITSMELHEIDGVERRIYTAEPVAK